MYQVEWVLENRIVLFRAVGDQTIETIEEGAAKLADYIENGDAPVHVISDSHYLGHFPASLNALKTIVNTSDNAGTTVAIGGDAMSNFVSNVITKLSGGKLELSDSVDGAIRKLQTIDPTLPRDIDYDDTPPAGH